MYIVLYDGHCGLCNGVVRFLLKIDRKHVLMFAPLQGETAQRLGVVSRDQYDTIVFCENSEDSVGRIATKSDAVFEILANIGGIWKASKLLLLFPRRVRDAIYDWIALNRNAWFTRYDACQVPSMSDRGRFLP